MKDINVHKCSCNLMDNALEWLCTLISATPPQRKEYIKSTLDSVFNVRPNTSPDKRSI